MLATGSVSFGSSGGSNLCSSIVISSVVAIAAIEVSLVLGSVKDKLEDMDISLEVASRSGPKLQT